METWGQENGGCPVLPSLARASFTVSALHLGVGVRYSFGVGSVEFFLHTTGIYTCLLRPLG